MKKENIFVGMFLLSLMVVVLCSSGVLAKAGQAEVNLPVAGTNSSGSIILNCTYENDTVAVTNANVSNWSFESGGTLTPITVTGLACGNSSCMATASASALTDGIGLNITCTIGNDSSHLYGGANATNLDFYTSTPVCSFAIDRNIVNWQDAIGIEISSNASTKDPVSTLAYAWVLWREDNTQSTTSTLGGDPTFSEGDFDEIGTFTLGLSVTDRWFNVATCTNQSITVQGTGGDDATIATTIPILDKVGTPTIVISLVILVFIIAIVVVLIVSKKK